MFPVGSVTAVDTENVAPDTVVVVVMLPAVADTSDAAVSVIPIMLFWALFCAPYWTVMAPVEPAELNACANSAEESWATESVVRGAGTGSGNQAPSARGGPGV